jgi:ribosomal protein S18 acetylase RimI-like enzyme
MEIRFLTPEDAVEWRRLRAEALETDPEAFSSSLEEHSRLSLDEVKNRLGGASDSFVAGAFEDGRLVGMAGFHRETGPKVRHKGRVWGVYVTASNRGKGLGRDLMREILKRVARIEGLDQIHLSVTETQAVALKLYRSLGFETFGREPRALKIGDRMMDEDYMILRLTPEQR